MYEITYTGVGAGSTARAALHWWTEVSKGLHSWIITNPTLDDYGVGMAPGSADPTLPFSTRAATYVVDFGTCAS